MWLKFTLVVSICLNLFLAYLVIDQSVSYGYLKVSYDEMQKQNEVMKPIVSKFISNYSREEVKILVKEVLPRHEIGSFDNVYSVGGLIFEFQDGRFDKFSD